MTGGLAVIQKTITPSLSSLFGADVALKLDDQQLGLRRPDDLLGVGAQILQVRLTT
jgi:hypothetical protein